MSLDAMDKNDWLELAPVFSDIEKTGITRLTLATILTPIFNAGFVITRPSEGDAGLHQYSVAEMLREIRERR